MLYIIPWNSLESTFYNWVHWYWNSRHLRLDLWMKYWGCLRMGCSYRWRCRDITTNPWRIKNIKEGLIMSTRCLSVLGVAIVIPCWMTSWLQTANILYKCQQFIADLHLMVPLDYTTVYHSHSFIDALKDAIASH